MLNNSPKPIIITIRAIILHTFGVQVGLEVGLGDAGFRGFRV